MYCVIQERQRKKPNLNGHHRDLEVYSTTINGGMPMYAYRYSTERFERPIKTAYKISIHESKRVEGVVTKKQRVVTTVDYYRLAEWGIRECVKAEKIASIATSFGVSVDYLWQVIATKADPLEYSIRREYGQSIECQTRVKHLFILTEYHSKKERFARRYDVSDDAYDYCYNVFGEVMNQAYIDEIIEADTWRKTAQSGSYHQAEADDSDDGNDDYAELFDSAKSTYTDEERLILHRFYRDLSKIYHPDKNPKADTHVEMVCLNKVKEEWGL